MQTMPTTNEYLELPYEVEILQQNEIANVYWIPKANAIICEAVHEYMPYDDFKILFTNISGYVAKYRPENFVFDKRALKAFHQPSMEWYFTEWKDEMSKIYGLKKHRKLLPSITWFALAVKAGRAELAKKYPDAEFHNLDIQYKDSIIEAINS
ncbi:MAG: hypothetical protein COZ18_13075 [Flexibacter sp. CG_4_10_14_3_um_filter_32_15]|nr:MAG: hypothetical protein COZ18_13075 [Flexibacter sp. CG_4_10_14_3_um_filter_32_15]